MTTKRDELAEIIYDSNRANTQVDLMDNRRLNGSQLAWAGYAADGLLAAGYRKPRAITQLQELGSVATGAVLIDALGQVWHKLGPAKYESTSGLLCLEPTRLPATVVHEPDES